MLQPSPLAEGFGIDGQDGVTGSHGVEPAFKFYGLCGILIPSDLYPGLDLADRDRAKA